MVGVTSFPTRRQQRPRHSRRDAPDALRRALRRALTAVLGAFVVLYPFLPTGAGPGTLEYAFAATAGALGALLFWCEGRA